MSTNDINASSSSPEKIPNLRRPSISILDCANIITTPYERVLTIINDAKNFVKSHSQNNNSKKLIDGLEWTIKVITSHSLYAYEIRETSLIKQISEQNPEFKEFVDFISKYNEDVIEMNKKSSLIGSTTVEVSNEVLQSSLSLKRNQLPQRKFLTNDKLAEVIKAINTNIGNYISENNKNAQSDNEKTHTPREKERNDFSLSQKSFENGEILRTKTMHGKSFSLIELSKKYKKDDDNKNINENKNIKENKKNMKKSNNNNTRNNFISNNKTSNNTKKTSLNKKSKSKQKNIDLIKKVKEFAGQKNKKKTEQTTSEISQNNPEKNNNYENKTSSADSTPKKGLAKTDDDFNMENSHKVLTPQSSTHIKMFSYVSIINSLFEENFDPKKIVSKSFNIFELKKIIGYENVLPLMGRIILDTFGLDNDRIINTDKLDNFLVSVQEQYYKSTLYHNAMHGADVTQMISLFFLNSNAEEVCETSVLDLLGILIACLGHDLGHPGLTNNFQINSYSKMAITYNDQSCLENFHTCKLFKTLRNSENDIFDKLNVQEFKTIRKRMISEILATDMANHGKIMTVIKSKITQNLLDNNNDKNAKFQLLSGNPKTKFEEQQSLLDLLIHSADLGHNAKLFKVSLKWVSLLTEEFWLQGDKEKSMNLPVSFLCDRSSYNIPQSQIGFIKGFIIPTFECVVQMFPTLQFTMDNAKKNLDEWKKLSNQKRLKGWTPKKNQTEEDEKKKTKLFEDLDSFNKFNKNQNQNHNHKNKSKSKNEKTMSDFRSPSNNGRIKKNSYLVNINLSGTTNNSKAKIKYKDVSMKPSNIMNKLKNMEVNNKLKEQKGVHRKTLK